MVIGEWRLSERNISREIIFECFNYFFFLKNKISDGHCDRSVLLGSGTVYFYFYFFLKYQKIIRRVVHGRGMRYGQGVRHAVRHAEVHLFAELQATRRSPDEGTGVRDGRRVVQVAVPAQEAIVSHQGPVAGGRLSRTVPE